MSDVKTASEVEVTAPGEVRVKRALITVSDKTGIAEFASCLRELGVEIVSTGGTARHLAEAGGETRPLHEGTGFPEMLDGRVKTINPKIAAGMLAVRDNPEHVATLNEHGIETIDLVCVNLYPLEQTAAKRSLDAAEAIENIDIGEPSLIGAAAKNFAFTAVVTGPESYDAIADELRASDGRLSM